MDSFVTPPPPAYEDENASSNYLWRIRNAKLCSQFSTTTPTHIPAYREHLERMKNIVVQQCSIKDSASKTHKSSVVNIQYREAFADIGQLICEYRDILNRIKPLQEEEVLFLLLSRYAQASGTDVYLEMRRPENVQIYDSSISEPLQTSTVESLSLQTPCMKKSKLSTQYPQESNSSRDLNGLNEHLNCAPIPESPSDVKKECSLTLNFPEMFLANAFNLSSAGASPDDPPVYNDPIPEAMSEGSDRKLGIPAFYLRRCQHRGIERGEGLRYFKLPSGFTEVIQHIHDTPPALEFYRTSYYMTDHTKMSLPRKEGGVQAFECRLLSTGVDVFITTERHGETLIYDCFKDKEAWVAFHQHHEGYTEVIGIM